MQIADLLKISGQTKVPLVIGGIGTESVIPYMRSLLRLNTNAKRDQDHIGYLLPTASTLPDRTEALLNKNNGDRSKYDFIAGKILEIAEFGKREGFEFMVAICNTIHIWREDKELGLNEKLNKMGIPWVSIMESAAEDLKQTYAPGTKIAVFATTGTLLSGLYHTALQNVGLIPVAPELDSVLQKDIMDAIYNPDYGIKAKGATPQAVKLLLQAPVWAQEQGAQVLIGGCTEIPLGLNSQTYQGKVTIVNPLESLAKSTLKLFRV